MVLIIAEAGVNHNGSIILAKKLIDAAKSSGADVIKFQSFFAENLVIPGTIKANYQQDNSVLNESQFEMLKKLELNLEEQKELKNYCDFKNIEFLSSAFDMDSLNLIKNLNIKRYKIPSGEITNLPYLRFVALQKKPIILSTGMSNIKEIGEALKELTAAGVKREDITVLHCTTEYPAPLEDVNLNAMLTIRDKFQIKVGYSDHTLGIEVSLAAVALGATIIEKHLTLDKSLNGPDHKASLEPEQFFKLVEGIRKISKSLGSYEKKISNSEQKNLSIVRKSIIAKTAIKEGDFFSSNNISAKRPGTGISPMLWDQVIGKRAKRNFKVNEQITLDL